jgi:hypothetical protein
MFSGKMLDNNTGLLSTSSANKNQKKPLNNSPNTLHLLIQDKEDGINETVNTHGELFNGFFWFLLAEDVDSKPVLLSNIFPLNMCIGNFISCLS